MTIRVTILGCGSSGGVPRVALGWGACDPKNPRNRRRRCAILTEKLGPEGITRVLVDAGPDLHSQLTDLDVRELDAVFLTHQHADHTHGLDDLRGFAIRSRRRVDVHCDAPTSVKLREAFGYCFDTPPGSDYPPILTEHRITPPTPVTINGKGGPLIGRAFHLNHGTIDALGFRFGGLAYTPDVKVIPDQAVPELEGLDIWVIDALRDTWHPSHFSLSDALHWIERLRPRRAVLTNMHTDLDYAELAARLPPHIEPAFDGMILEVE